MFLKVFLVCQAICPTWVFNFLRVFLVYVSAMHHTYVDIFGTIYTVFCQFQRKRKGVVRIMAALVWPL